MVAVETFSRSSKCQESVCTHCSTIDQIGDAPTHRDPGGLAFLSGDTRDFLAFCLMGGAAIPIPIPLCRDCCTVTIAPCIFTGTASSSRVRSLVLFSGLVLIAHFSLYEKAGSSNSEAEVARDKA